MLGLRRSPDFLPLQKAYKTLQEADQAKVVADQQFKAGKYKEAISSYQKLLGIIVNNKKFEAICQSNISSCYFKLKDNDNALEYIKKAVKSDPKYDKAFYRKGDVEKSMGNYVEAE